MLEISAKRQRAPAGGVSMLHDAMLMPIDSQAPGHTCCSALQNMTLSYTRHWYAAMRTVNNENKKC